MKFGFKLFAPALLAASLLAPSLPAIAAPSPVAATASVQIAAKQDAGGPVGSGQCEENLFSVQKLADSPVLADMRWQDAAAGLHSRVDNTKIVGVDTGFSAKGMSRDMAGALMNGGTAIWGWTSSLVNGSVSFCAPQAVFASVDKAAGNLGGMITKGANGLAGLFLALTLIGCFIVAYRRKSFPVKELLSKVLALGILTVMVTGALGSKEVNGTYKPGFMSPGYVASGFNDAIKSIAKGPADLLAKGIVDNPSEDKTDNWCASYVSSMHKAYEKENGYIDGSQIPISMAEMWTSAGGKTWSDSQYGSSGNGSQYANGSWCMHLEMRRDQASWDGELFKGGILNVIKEVVGEAKDEGKVDLSDKVADFKNPILKQLWKDDSKAYKSAQKSFANGSLAWHAKSVENVDQSVIAWASCKMKGGSAAKAADLDLASASSWEARPGVGKDVTAEACAQWFSGADKQLKAFNWPTGVEAIQKHATSVGASTEFVKYVMYLHGESNSSTMAAAFTYLVSSLILLVIFGLLALGVFVAQIALVFVSLALILAVIHWAVPFTHGGPKNVMKAFKAMLGLSLVSLAVVGLFTFVALLTRIVQSLGESMGSTLFQAIWTGLSPVIAVLVIHLIFSRVLKKPSPFSLSGATAWANTLSGGGGAAGLGGLASMTGRVDRAAGARSRDLMERVPGVSRGMDAMHRAGITKTGSRRGAQAAADPEKRAAKAAMAAMQQAGMDPGVSRPGAGPGMGVPGADGVPGGSQAGPGRRGQDGGLNQSADVDKMSALLAGAELDDNGNPIKAPDKDPNADLDALKLQEGQDPAEAIKGADLKDSEIESKITELELGKIDRAENRASKVSLGDARQTQVAQHLMANVHHTGIDNSQLEEVAVGGKQKEVAAKVAKLEREQAAKWAKEEAKAGKQYRKDQIRQGINPETGEEFAKGEAPTMGKRAKDLMASQLNDFKKKPVRTIAKNAAIGAAASVAIAAVAPGALLAAPLAMLAPTAVNAASRRTKAVRAAMVERRNQTSTAGQDQMVAQYRAHLRTEDKDTQAQIQQLRQRQSVVRAHRSTAEAAASNQREQAKEQLKQSEAATTMQSMAGGPLASQAKPTAAMPQAGTPRTQERSAPSAPVSNPAAGGGRTQRPAPMPRSEGAGAQQPPASPGAKQAAPAAGRPSQATPAASRTPQVNPAAGRPLQETPATPAASRTPQVNPAAGRPLQATPAASRPSQATPAAGRPAQATPAASRTPQVNPSGSGPAPAAQRPAANPPAQRPADSPRARPRAVQPDQPSAGPGAIRGRRAKNK